MTINIIMNDRNSNKELKLYPHHRESQLRITQIIGNPPICEELASVWIKNEDLKKAIKAIDDLS